MAEKRGCKLTKFLSIYTYTSLWSIVCCTERESRGTKESAEHRSENITGFARQAGQGTTMTEGL